MSLPMVTQFISKISPSKGEINQLVLFSFYLFDYLFNHFEMQALSKYL